MTYTEIIAVVVSYNGSKDLQQTVKALQNNVGHIHIVDNGSNNNTLDVLKLLKNESNISITYLNKNQGIGYALNIGVIKGAELGYNWLLTMDQDSIISSNMIEEFCKAIKCNSKLTCLTPSISVFENENTFNKIRNNDNIVKYAITSGNLVKLDVFDIIGLYNEKLFIDCVDFDFSLRLREAGYTINLIQDAKLFHQLGEKHNVPKLFSRFYTLHSPLRRYYMYRNWGYILQKYFKNFPLFIIKSTIIHIMLLIIISLYDKKPKQSLTYIYLGIKDFFRNQFGPLKI